MISVKMLPLTLLLAIMGLSSSVIIEREISPPKSAETEEGIMKMNDRVFQCEEELKGRCDIFINLIVDIASLNYLHIFTRSL